MSLNGGGGGRAGPGTTYKVARSKDAVYVRIVGLANMNNFATFNDFATATKERTVQEGDHTPVWRAFPSNAVLQDKMFTYVHP